MALLEKFGPLLGRILIAYLYIPAGISKITGFSNTVGYIASKNLPLPQVAAAGAIVVEVVVALALLVGFKTRFAALILAAFTLAANVVFHNYWAMEGQAAFTNQLMFAKNLAVIGGLLFVATFGAGPLSVDRR